MLLSSLKRQLSILQIYDYQKQKLCFLHQNSHQPKISRNSIDLDFCDEQKFLSNSSCCTFFYQTLIRRSFSLIFITKVILIVEFHELKPS